MVFPRGPLQVHYCPTCSFHTIKKTGRIELKPCSYRRYVGIFLIKGMLREYMSFKHQDINFTVEHKNVGKLSLLDVKVCRQNDKFVTSVYRKPTFSGIFTNYVIFTNFISFIPAYQQRGLLHTLRHSIYCDFKKFHLEMNYLKIILKKDNYPANFIDQCIESYLGKLYTLKVMVQNVPKRNVFVKLPFSESTSFKIRRKLQKLFTDKLTACNIKVVFTS